MAHTTYTGQNAAGHGCQLQAVLDAHASARNTTGTAYESAMSGADWGSGAKGAAPAQLIPVLLSTKKSVNDVTGTQPANARLQPQPWPQGPTAR